MKRFSFSQPSIATLFGYPHDFKTPLATDAPLVGELPDEGCELCVAIPVYNEQEGIVRTLSALAAQLDLAGRPMDRRRYEVLLLANNCHDQTVPLARQFAVAHPTLRLRIIEIRLEPPYAHVGAARRLVMDEACRRLLRLGRRRGVIASTDGDTCVASTWVAATLDEIERGSDAVGGRILSSHDEVANLDPGTRLYYRRDCAYRVLRAAYDHALDSVPHNPWPRHFQYFGASLAVTAEAYLAAGGLPVVHCLEDMAFERALHRLDVRLRHSPQVSVLTSLRCSGKVCVGLASTLSRWTEAAKTKQPLMVESADAIKRAALDRRALRELWEGGRAPKEGPKPSNAVARAARVLELNEKWLSETLRVSRSFGSLHEAVSEQQARQGVGHSTLPAAEVQQTNAELRERLAVHREPARCGVLTVFRTNPAGNAPRVVPRDDEALAPLFGEMLRGPGRPSKDNHARTASSEPTASVRQLSVG